MIEISGWNIDFEKMRMWGHNKHTNESYMYQLFPDYHGSLMVQTGSITIRIANHLKTNPFWKQLNDAWIDYIFERDLLSAETDTINK